MKAVNHSRRLESDEVLVHYVDGETCVHIATIRRDAGGIHLTLESAILIDIPFTRQQLECFLRRMIELPLKVRNMRRSAMPDHFPDLMPGSKDHFERIYREYGPFRIMERN